jgi:Xaa-Pro aminopeptidase
VISMKNEAQFAQPDVPRFTTAERDRRWRRVRSLMARDQIDCIVALENSGKWDTCSAYGRYLATIGGNSAGVSVVFPQVEEPTAIVGPVPGVSYWRLFQDWINDIRVVGFDPVPAIAGRIRDLGQSTSRIGIAGLGAVSRQPGGLVAHGSYQSLRAALPRLELVDATALLDEARFVKSVEEIEFLAKGVQLAELARGALAENARPDAAECAVYAQMTAVMISAGGENSMLLWSTGAPQPPGPAMLASRRALAAGDVIIVEIDGKWGGYLGHNAYTGVVGTPDLIYRELAEAQVELTRTLWQAMRPGTSLAALLEICRRRTQEGPFIADLVLHSRGLGLDPPIVIRDAADDLIDRWTLEENACFIVKPWVLTPDRSRGVVWGDTVVVTGDGAERLGTAAPGLVPLGI